MTDSTTSSGVDQLISNYYNERAQDRLVANFVFYRFADKKKLGKGNGQTMITHRFGNISGSTSTLAETTTTAGQVQLTATTTTVTVAPYGQFITISNFAVDTMHTSDLVEAATDVLADSASDTVDILVRNNLISNATKFFGNATATTSATITTSDVLAPAGLRLMYRNFVKNKVRPFRDGKKYIYIASPMQTYDLKGDDTVGGFLQTHQYSNPEAIMDNEIGALCGFRIVETPQVLSTTAVTSALSSSSLGYLSYAIGEHAQTAVDLEGSPIEIIIHRAGTGGVSDPYNNLNTIAYKLPGFGVIWQGNDADRAYAHITAVTA